MFRACLSYLHGFLALMASRENQVVSMEDKRQRMMLQPWLCPFCPPLDFYSCQLTRNISPSSRDRPPCLTAILHARESQFVLVPVH